GVYLLRRLQVLQLLEAGEGPELIGVRAELNPLEQLPELPGTVSRGVAALEPRKLPMDALEAYAITSVVGRGGADGHLAAGKLLRDDRRDLSDPIVLRILTDVENLAPHGLFRSAQTPIDRLADIEHVDQRPPRATVTHHRDPPRRPRQRA